MAVETPPIFIQSGGETAERARRYTAAQMGLRGGIVAAGDLAVTENGTPNMSVNVATGQVFIPGTEGTYQGLYSVENRGVLNVAISAADPTNPRKDLIVAKVQDAFYSGALNVASIVAVTGTPAGSPAEPAAPANSWVLAMVDVPANDTAITNSQITDRRSQQTGQKGRAGALGGFVVCTQGNRPAHQAGLFIFETDTNRAYVSTGSQWRLLNHGIDAAQADVATSQTTTSTSFTDLTTVGPAVTVYMEPGQKAIVVVSCRLFVTTGGAGHASAMSWAVSGTETVAAADVDGLFSLNATGAGEHRQERSGLFTAAGSAGTRTFTAKYKTFAGGDTSTFLERRILVSPQS